MLQAAREAAARVEMGRAAADKAAAVVRAKAARAAAAARAVAAVRAAAAARATAAARAPAVPVVKAAVPRTPHRAVPTAKLPAAAKPPTVPRPRTNLPATRTAPPRLPRRLLRTTRCTPWRQGIRSTESASNYIPASGSWTTSCGSTGWRTRIAFTPDRSCWCRKPWPKDGPGGRGLIKR